MSMVVRFGLLTLGQVRAPSYLLDFLFGSRGLVIVWFLFFVCLVCFCFCLRVLGCISRRCCDSRVIFLHPDGVPRRSRTGYIVLPSGFGSCSFLACAWTPQACGHRITTAAVVPPPRSGVLWRVGCVAPPSGAALGHAWPRHRCRGLGRAGRSTACGRCVAHCRLRCFRFLSLCFLLVRCGLVPPRPLPSSPGGLRLFLAPRPWALVSHRPHRALGCRSRRMCRRARPSWASLLAAPRRGHRRRRFRQGTWGGGPQGRPTLRQGSRELLGEGPRRMACRHGTGSFPSDSSLPGRPLPLASGHPRLPAGRRPEILACPILNPLGRGVHVPPDLLGDRPGIVLGHRQGIRSRGLPVRFLLAPGGSAVAPGAVREQCPVFRAESPPLPVAFLYPCAASSRFRVPPLGAPGAPQESPPGLVAPSALLLLPRGPRRPGENTRAAAAHPRAILGRLPHCASARLLPILFR